VTVREAFEKAWGPIPDGATCHVLSIDDSDEEMGVMPMCLAPDGWVYVPKYPSDSALGAEWKAKWEKDWWFSVWVPDKTDIGDQPASAFVGLLHGWLDYGRVVAEDQAAWRAALHGARVTVSELEDDGA
jgi:hypothetical protein